MTDFAPLLLGKDLRSLKKNNEVVLAVQDQSTFDELFALLWHHERPLVMRAADAVEKITVKHKEFLVPHKVQLLSLLHGAINKELKWHIAQLLPRLPLTAAELHDMWGVLSYWAQNPNESKIVRVNALQGLFDLCLQHEGLRPAFEKIMTNIHHEPIPSIQARIKKIRKTLDRAG